MSDIHKRYPDIPKLLQAIRAKPGMFLGQQTIQGLGLLLAGIKFAEDYHDIPVKARMGGFDWEPFEKWVETAYNPRRLSLRSFGLAFHLAGSDLEGFELWFRWYDEFNQKS